MKLESIKDNFWGLFVVQSCRNLGHLYFLAFRFITNIPIFLTMSCHRGGHELWCRCVSQRWTWTVMSVCVTEVDMNCDVGVCHRGGHELWCRCVSQRWTWTVMSVCVTEVDMNCDVGVCHRGGHELWCRCVSQRWTWTVMSVCVTEVDMNCDVGVCHRGGHELWCRCVSQRWTWTVMSVCVTEVDMNCDVGVCHRGGHERGRGWGGGGGGWGRWRLVCGWRWGDGGGCGEQQWAAAHPATLHLPHGQLVRNVKLGVRVGLHQERLKAAQVLAWVSDAISTSSVCTG